MWLIMEYTKNAKALPNNNIDKIYFSKFVYIFYYAAADDFDALVAI